MRQQTYWINIIMLLAYLIGGLVGHLTYRPKPLPWGKLTEIPEGLKP